MKLLEKLSYLGVVLPTFSSLGGGDDFSESILSDGLRVSMYRTWPANAQLLADWSALARSLPMGTVFQSPAWQGALARPFIRVGRYLLLAVQQGASIRAVLPLQLGGGGALETPGEMISDYLEPLIAPETETQSWQLLLGMLKAQARQMKVPIVLHNVPADGRCRAALIAQSRDAGFSISDEESSSAARITLPKSWDEYLGTLDGRERKELKRKIKNATTQMNARLVITESGEALETDLQRALALIEQAGGAKRIKSRWTYRPIFKRATRELVESKQLQVYTLMLAEKPAASLICFPTANGPLMWAGGFDSEMKKFSPGIVLFGLSIKHSIETGAKYFDLLRGQHRYKGELGAGDYPLRKLTLRLLV